MIHLITRKVVPIQIQEMLESLDSYIKVAVDIKREILAGGGVMHADCEAVLLDNGSKQEDIWGADWLPQTQEVRYEALINIRPPRNNRSMEIQDKAICVKVEKIMRGLLSV